MLFICTAHLLELSGALPPFFRTRARRFLGSGLPLHIAASRAHFWEKERRDVGSLEQNFVDSLVEQMTSFLLGGRAWMVQAINHTERIVAVKLAPRGKKPSWGGFLPQVLGFELWIGGVNQIEARLLVAGFAGARARSRRGHAVHAGGRLRLRPRRAAAAAHVGEVSG